MVITGRTVCVFGRQGAGRVPSLSSQFSPHLPLSSAQARWVSAQLPKFTGQGPSCAVSNPRQSVGQGGGGFLARVPPINTPGLSGARRHCLSHVPLLLQR